MDLENGVCLDRVEKVCYHGDMMNGGRGENSALVAISALCMRKV